MKTILVIAGPTAVGKTDLAVHLAETFRTSIISADSRQCYREMDIGVARPSPEELMRVPHYFIATHSVTETVNAAVFTEEAQRAADGIFATRDVALLVGGTGLYIQAFTEGLDDIPPVPQETRNAVRQGYAANGMTWLQEELKRKDPEWYATGETQNPHRLMRALEVLEATGQSIRAFQKGRKESPYNVIKVGLELPRDVLYDRINKRVDQMMDRGLENEVEGLQKFKTEKALDTVGYKELFDYLDGKTTKENAVALIKQHTRNYAKRQMTWFKRDPDFRWFGPQEREAVTAYLNGIS